MIYHTSYFFNFNIVPNPISIAKTSPNIYGLKKYQLLIPSWKLIKLYKIDKLINEIEYINIYLNEIKNNGFTIKKFLNDLPNNSTLLCWEKPNDFCHRHIIRKLLNDNNINCNEYNSTGIINFNL